jgi:hypothetical protein
MYFLWSRLLSFHFLSTHTQSGRKNNIMKKKAWKKCVFFFGENQKMLTKWHKLFSFSLAQCYLLLLLLEMLVLTWMAATIEWKHTKSKCEPRIEKFKMKILLFTFSSCRFPFEVEVTAHAYALVCVWTS